jgi:putative restriction endonuclease
MTDETIERGGKTGLPQDSPWSTQAFRTWVKLTRAAAQSEFLTYEDVAYAIGAIPVNIGKILEPIQAHCEKQDLPRLTGLVVNKATGLPGRGFKGSVEEYRQDMEEVFEFDWASTPNPFPPGEASQGEDRFGEVPGVAEGDVFASYEELRQAGVHRDVRQGITGNKKDGAESIVLAGHYEDVDNGDVIYYTGQGGQGDGRQVEDQSLRRMRNPALVTSMVRGAPVRVVRANSPDGSATGRSSYEYAGLYQVVDAAEVVGSEGRTICRFKLVKLGTDFSDTLDPLMAAANGVLYPGEHQRTTMRSSGETALSHSNAPAPMEVVTVVRRIRDSQVTRRVKAAHADTCQICGTVVTSPRGTHAEGCHIQPISRRGPDIESNVLCLCPNCHVLFDNGAFQIDDDLNVRNIRMKTVIGQLTTVPQHEVSRDMLKWHREEWS